MKHVDKKRKKVQKYSHFPPVASIIGIFFIKVKNWNKQLFATKDGSPQMN